ncbi:MAG: phosphonate ABC transporter ATP-binding protein [Akkermansiaceae bacterium]
MLEFQSATLSYRDVTAIDSLDLAIAPGEQVCLIGPSGCGKTSLLGLINHRFKPTSGQVSVHGRDLATLNERNLRKIRAKIAWVPQDLGLVDNLRVSQNVACGRAAEKGFWKLLRSLVWMSRHEKEVILKVLRKVGIEEKIFTRLDQLSGGQQQRVAIARALYQRPEIILADEPVSAVDPERAKDLIELLTSLAKREDKTLVVSLHDVELAKRYFNRIIGLRGGRVVMDGSPDELDLETLYQLD